MPRRKQQKIDVTSLKCRDVLIKELSQNPLLANYDMGSIELTIKENKPAPQIKKNIDLLINTLQRSYAANKHLLETFDGKEVINNTTLARLLKVSRPTMNKWIDDGLIRPFPDRKFPFDIFNVADVIEQLRKQKQ